MAKKLTELHPFTKKVRQIEDLCYELGVSINIRYNGLYLCDSDGNGYHYRDNEETENNCHAFPHFLETKLIVI